MAAKQGCLHYLLRNVEDSLWRRVKARAALEGRDVREVIIEALETFGMEDTKIRKLSKRKK